MQNSNNIVFFGSGPVSTATLDGIEPQLQIEAIITKPSSRPSLASVANWAKAHNLPHFEPASSSELAQLFARRHFSSQVGLVVDYGLIIPTSVIEAFNCGIVNSHFSLLPRYRGADPITFAILNGDQKTGVSLMKIVAKLDAGPIIAQESCSISTELTTPELTEKLIKISNQMIKKQLPLYVAGKLKPQAQDPTITPTYSRKLTKADGLLEWTKPASQIEREIRGYLGWPASYGQLAGKHVIITKAKVSNQKLAQPQKPGALFITKSDQLAVQTGKGQLIVSRLKPAGKREMSAREFMSGYIS